MKKKEAFISDEGYVSKSDIVGTVFISLSVVSIIIMIILAILTFYYL